MEMKSGMMSDVRMGLKRNENPKPVTRRAALVLLLLITGCEKPTKGMVSGTVLVDNVPAKSGSIAFFPVDERSTTAGGEIVDGQYAAEVPFGKFKVEIRVPKVIGQKKLYNTPNSPVMPLLEESLPVNYNDETELTIDVEPGENQRDFQLSTQ